MPAKSEVFMVGKLVGGCWMDKRPAGVRYYMYMVSDGSRLCTAHKKTTPTKNGFIYRT